MFLKNNLLILDNRSPFVQRLDFFLCEMLVFILRVTRIIFIIFGISWAVDLIIILFLFCLFLIIALFINFLLLDTLFLLFLGQNILIPHGNQLIISFHEDFVVFIICGKLHKIIIVRNNTSIDVDCILGVYTLLWEARENIDHSMVVIHSFIINISIQLYHKTLFVPALLTP